MVTVLENEPEAIIQDMAAKGYAGGLMLRFRLANCVHPQVLKHLARWMLCGGAAGRCSDRWLVVCALGMAHVWVGNGQWMTQLYSCCAAGPGAGAC